jgi:hypothetical protein
MDKCVLCEGNMLTPSEFELNGGKKANKAWKKSIKHKNKSLAKYFASGALKEFTGLELVTPLPLSTATPHTYTWKGNRYRLHIQRSRAKAYPINRRGSEVCRPVTQKVS